jgi:hypothetical protein
LNIYKLIIINLIIIIGGGFAAAQPPGYIYPGNSPQEYIRNSNSNVFYLMDGIHDGPLNLNNCRDMTIKSFHPGRATIECSGADVGISILGGNNITIEGLNLNNSNDGVKISGVGDCIIKDNNIKFNNGSGILIEGTNGSQIIRNVIINENSGNIRGYGILAIESNSNFISENRFLIPSSSNIISLYNSFNNNITLDQCGVILDNSNKCNCTYAIGCYMCEEEGPLENNWTLNPGFC